MRLILAGVVLSGCAYQPSSFRSEFQSFPGTHATAGCLDIAVERRQAVHDQVVLGYAFGNRCDQPVLVDFASATVIGRSADGHTRTLRPYDPRGEIAALWLDGRAVGREAIAYEGSTGLVDVCVDTGTVARSPMSVWLCLASQPPTPEAP